MNLLWASAARPISSCTAARAAQAPHQSSHDLIEPVTSSKSLSATPLATKRGAQWEIAAATRGSEAMDQVLSSVGIIRRESFGFVVAAVPGQETPRAPVHDQLNPEPKSREQQHADEGFVVGEGARVKKDIIAEPADRE